MKSNLFDKSKFYKLDFISNNNYYVCYFIKKSPLSFLKFEIN